MHFKSEFGIAKFAKFTAKRISKRGIIEKMPLWV